ncbi:MAG: hypothetical protein WBZ36_31300, partial [Candidatus Nitrosopolaris sp.]
MVVNVHHCFTNAPTLRLPALIQELAHLCESLWKKDLILAHLEACVRAQQHGSNAFYVAKIKKWLSQLA